MVKSLAKQTKTLCETILFWKTIIPPLMFIVVNMRVFSLKNNSMNIQGVREQDCNVFKLIVFSKILCINAVSAVCKVLENVSTDQLHLSCSISSPHLLVQS